jgi:hypothetical protein
MWKGVSNYALLAMEGVSKSIKLIVNPGAVQK